MSKERIIYPNYPEQWTWDGYKAKFPMCNDDITIEKEHIKNKINDFKLKLFGLIGATPKDITNDNDDPFDYVTTKFNNIINDFKFIMKKNWYINMIDEYQNSIKEGNDENLVGTIDTTTGHLWEPYIDIVGMCADSKYSCINEIEENTKIEEMLIQELMSYTIATPKNAYTDSESDCSFNDVFFRTREILSQEDGLLYYWNQIFNWEFAFNNWNSKSYNSY